MIFKFHSSEGPASHMALCFMLFSISTLMSIRRKTDALLNYIIASVGHSCLSSRLKALTPNDFQQISLAYTSFVLVSAAL